VAALQPHRERLLYQKESLLDGATKRSTDAPGNRSSSFTSFNREVCCRVALLIGARN